MSQDEFTKLFAYMQQRFDQLDTKLDNKADKDQLNTALNMLDSVLKNQEIEEQERLVISHQLDEVKLKVRTLEAKYA